MNSANLCSPAGQYDNSIPSGFLAPIDCLKIPAQVVQLFPWLATWKNVFVCFDKIVLEKDSFAKFFVF